MVGCTIGTMLKRFLQIFHAEPAPALAAAAAAAESAAAEMSKWPGVRPGAAVLFLDIDGVMHRAER